MKKLVVPLVLTLGLGACTKTVVVSNGEQTKKIKVSGDISMVKDSLNNTYTTFESVHGTRFNINMAEYALTIK